MMKKNNRCRVDGVLLLDKPFAISSNAALQKARWLFNAQKAGHTGSLDPFATGLLPVCFGEATKFAQRWLDADKGYRATIRLGATSTTGDGEGEIVETHEPLPDDAAVRSALLHFLGPITQIPPMYSALKYKGRALYEYARQGLEIERRGRQVNIKALNLVSRPDACTVVVDVLCSKGTYIRVLAQDIGRYLGCGAYLNELRRTRTGVFTLDKAFTLSEIELMPPAQRGVGLLPVDALLSELDCITVTQEDGTRLLQGMPLLLNPDVTQKKYTKGEYRLYVNDKASDNTEFIGLGIVNDDGQLCPGRMLARAVAALTGAACSE